MKSQEEEKLKATILQRLKRSDIHELLWQNMKQTIKDALDATDAQERRLYEDRLVDGLRKAMRTIFEVNKRTLPPGRQRHFDPQYTPSEFEHERRMAELFYYSRNFAEMPGVVRFKQQLGRLLPVDQIWSFLTSPVNQFFSFADLQEWGIGPFQAGGKAVDDEWVITEEGLRRRVTVFIQGLGSQKTAIHDPDKKLALTSSQLIGDSQFLIDTYVTRPWDVEFPSPFFSPFPISNERPMPIVGYEGTVVGEALRISDDIAVKHQMEAKDALIFLLTGQLPPISPIRTVVMSKPSYNLDNVHDKSTWGPVVLVVEPWVSVATLQQHYKVLQKDMLGKDNCAATEKSLALFKFVNDNWHRVEAKNKTEKWKGLLDLWRENVKETWLEGAYQPSFDWRNLRTTYNRIKNVLLPPLN